MITDFSILIKNMNQGIFIQSSAEIRNSVHRTKIQTVPAIVAQGMNQFNPAACYNNGIGRANNYTSCAMYTVVCYKDFFYPGIVPEILFLIAPPEMLHIRCSVPVFASQRIEPLNNIFYPVLHG